MSDETTPDELAEALDPAVSEKVFFVKRRNTTAKRTAVIEQAFRDARAWLEVGHDFDIRLVRVTPWKARLTDAVSHKIDFDTKTVREDPKTSGGAA